MHEAKFKVGFKTIRSEKYGNEVQVYYPISKDVKVRLETDVPVLPHGDKTLKGLLLLALGNFLSEDSYWPTFILNSFKDVFLGVVKNAPLSPNLRNKKLVPIFFSHGLTLSPHHYTRVLMDLARCGYIVFGIFH